uniref:Uncharacterized protein n=1 Tax=Timema cristinae TaxID=61476 RepID=A0A7R9GTF5_TIMCR|nr:unnamed protein product [Timema cristinae]
MEDATVLSPERPHNFHLPFDMDGDGDSASSQALCEREGSPTRRQRPGRKLKQLWVSHINNIA